MKVASHLWRFGRSWLLLFQPHSKEAQMPPFAQVTKDDLSNTITSQSRSPLWYHRSHDNNIILAHI
jgi:hypothetical protein